MGQKPHLARWVTENHLDHPTTRNPSHTTVYPPCTYLNQSYTDTIPTLYRPYTLLYRYNTIIYCPYTVFIPTPSRMSALLLSVGFVAFYVFFCMAASRGREKLPLWGPCSRSHLRYGPPVFSIGGFAVPLRHRRILLIRPLLDEVTVGVPYTEPILVRIP